MLKNVIIGHLAPAQVKNLPGAGDSLVFYFQQELMTTDKQL